VLLFWWMQLIEKFSKIDSTGDKCSASGEVALSLLNAMTGRNGEAVKVVKLSGRSEAGRK
jgi:hypothetical protein